MVGDLATNNLYQAATARFDAKDPAQALTDIVNLTCDLLSVERAVLYEFEESEGSFTPRYAHGVAMAELGRVSRQAENPLLSKALDGSQAVSTGQNGHSLGLPLAPGTIACTPCRSGEQTIGLLFAGTDLREDFTPEELRTLEVLGARAGEILFHARQTAAQNYLFHKLSLLYQASHAITGTLDRAEAIRQTAAHLLKATSAESCDVLIFIDNGMEVTHFRQQLGKSMQPKVISTASNNLPDYPIHKQVVNELQPAIVSLAPPMGSSKDLAMLEGEGLTCAAVFPLSTRNEALGFVRLLYTQPGRVINDQEMELAHAIINIGAVGVQDALHLEAAQARASELQTLGEIGREMTSTLDLEVALENAMVHTQRLLKAEAVVLFLLDERGDKLYLKASGGTHMRIRDVAIRLEEGIAGWVTRNNQPLIVNDVRTNPLYHSAIDGQTGLLTSSVLCVPLERRGEVLGVIQAINHPRGVFTQGDQELLSSVASWAAVALDNANLFRSVADERSRLETTLVETADAVVLTDSTGYIILINQAAGQAFRINPDLAIGRLASDIFVGHPLGDLLLSDEITLPTNLEVTTPTERVLYTTISEISNVGRVAVMQDITALKQIDRMRSQLLGTAAHDLKNPLNAIRLGADLLNDAPLSDQQRKALNMMQRATDSMTNLITGLLETIRVESSSSLEYEPFQVNDLIRRGIEDLKPLADAQNQTISYEPPEESLLIVGDPNRLNSVMANLLSNAIKFSGLGAHIKVGINWNEDEIQVSVSDDGPGIPEDEIPRVFEHLFRGRITVQDPSNPIDGTGLGLALAKTVIEQHGGKIWVTSKEGEGSTFTFALPREPTPKTGSLRQD